MRTRIVAAWPGSALREGKRELRLPRALRSGARDVAAALFRRHLAFFLEVGLEIGSRRRPLETARLLVETAQRAQALVAAELRLFDGALQDGNGPVVHAEGHRERMRILAPVRQREPRRIGEPARGA